MKRYIIKTAILCFTLCFIFSFGVSCSAGGKTPQNDAATAQSNRNIKEDEKADQTTRETTEEDNTNQTTREANTEMNEKIIETKSGLKYIDIKEGVGEMPKNGDMVVVHYTGVFENGQKFDSSVDRGMPFKFRLGMKQVIPGWDEGVSTMKPGGKRRLIIPGSLGYGPKGIVDRGKVIIPPNATLIFDVEFIEVE